MIAVNADLILLYGKVLKGPDYRLHLIPKYVDTERWSQMIEAQSPRIRSIKVVENFLLNRQEELDVKITRRF